MSILGITLIPYTKYPPTRLASYLVELVESNVDRLRIDFPGVLVRYANESVAEESVRAVQGAMRRRNDFGGYAVTHDERVIGVVSLDQQMLRGPRRFTAWRREVLASGPQFAVWLRRHQRPNRLLPAILIETVFAMRRLPGLRGTPWTLVRTDHGYTRRVLADSGNVFGGFEIKGDPDDYRRVDGVERLRHLWVARRSVASLTA